MFDSKKFLFSLCSIDFHFCSYRLFSFSKINGIKWNIILKKFFVQWKVKTKKKKIRRQQQELIADVLQWHILFFWLFIIKSVSVEVCFDNKNLFINSSLFGCWRSTKICSTFKSILFISCQIRSCHIMANHALQFHAITD